MLVLAKCLPFRCIYMQSDTAYELQVEIIKDYADVRKDIQDVVNIIERDDNYEKTVQKVKTLLGSLKPLKYYFCNF